MDWDPADYQDPNPPLDGFERVLQRLEDRGWSWIDGAAWAAGRELADLVAFSGGADEFVFIFQADPASWAARRIGRSGPR